MLILDICEYISTLKCFLSTQRPFWLYLFGGRAMFQVYLVGDEDKYCDVYTEIILLNCLPLRKRGIKVTV